MEVNMALVRRAGAAGAAIGRAQVPGAVAVPAIPAQPGNPPTQEMAAAVPSLPAKAWSVVTGLGLTGLGAVGAWNIHTMVQPTAFQIGDTPSTFAAMFVFSAAVERVLEPLSRFMPGRSAQEKYEKAVADMENGVPGAMNAAAHFKAAVDSARASRGVLMWGLATFAATLMSAGSGFYLLRALSANPNWNGVAAWADALLTGLVVGSGTKPVHDVLTRVQQRTNAAQTPF
jgi:hypothetical protein